MAFRTIQWVIIYSIFIAIGTTSLVLASLNFKNLDSLKCFNCPNGKNGTDGEPGKCEYCCPDSYHNPLTGAFMMWTQGNVIAPTITPGIGWAFTNEREFAPSGVTDISLSNMTIANFPFGVWQFTYEICLQIGTTIVLQQNSSTVGSNFTDINSLSGATITETWISGLSIENITDTYKGFLVTTTSTSARSVKPGPSNGLPLFRFTAIQYVN